MSYTGPYDAEFTPEMESLLKRQIKWLKDRCGTTSAQSAKYGHRDSYLYGQMLESVQIKAAFERQLRRLRHEARERAHAKATTP